MKQHISVDQLAELTPRQKEKLRELWKPQEGDRVLAVINGRFTTLEYLIVINSNFKKEKTNDLPLLSIGQMIEILKREGYLEMKLFGVINEDWRVVDSCMAVFYEDELCDALFEALKAVL